MAGGGSSGTQTTTTAPWAGQQPYLTNLWQQAQGLPQQQPYPFPGFVPWSPASATGMEAMTGRALAGSPVLSSAQAENLRTTGGAYLDPTQNPMFQQAFQEAQRQIIPQVEGSAVAAGRYGGGLPQEQLTERLGGAFAQQWAPLYQSERERMLRASLAGPAMAEADYGDIERLMGVGGMQEAKAGEALQDAMRRWQFQQQAPYTQIGAQAPIIGGTSFGQTMTQPTQGMSPLAGGLGGGMLGYQLAPMMGLGGPMGAAAGAGLGLLAAMM